MQYKLNIESSTIHLTILELRNNLKIKNVRIIKKNCMINFQDTQTP